MGDDDFWVGTNPSEVPIDIANINEIMTGSHITEQHTLKYQEPVLPELLNMTRNETNHKHMICPKIVRFLK